MTKPRDFPRTSVRAPSSRYAWPSPPLLNQRAMRDKGGGVRGERARDGGRWWRWRERCGGGGWARGAPLALAAVCGMRAPGQGGSGQKAWEKKKQSKGGTGRRRASPRTVAWRSEGGTGRRRAPPSHGRAEAWQGRGGARGWRGGTRGGASGSPVATPQACDRSRRSSRGPRPRPVGSGEGGTGRRLSGIAARPGSTA